MEHDDDERKRDDVERREDERQLRAGVDDEGKDARQRQKQPCGAPDSQQRSGTGGRDGNWARYKGERVNAWLGVAVRPSVRDRRTIAQGASTMDDSPAQCGPHRAGRHKPPASDGQCDGARRVTESAPSRSAARAVAAAARLRRDPLSRRWARSNAPQTAIPALRAAQNALERAAATSCDGCCRLGAARSGHRAARARGTDR